MDVVRLQPDRLKRAAARVLAFLLLWMATGGVLTHSDALTWGRSASAQAAVHHAAAPAPPSDLCAACQWTQGLQTGSAVLLRVTSPAIQPRPRSVVIPAPLTAPALDLASARAPPCLP